MYINGRNPRTHYRSAPLFLRATADYGRCQSSVDPVEVSFTWSVVTSPGTPPIALGDSKTTTGTCCGESIFVHVPVSASIYLSLSHASFLHILTRTLRRAVHPHAHAAAQRRLHLHRDRLAGRLRFPRHLHHHLGLCNHHRGAVHAYCEHTGRGTASCFLHSYRYGCVLVCGCIGSTPSPSCSFTCASDYLMVARTAP